MLRQLYRVLLTSVLDKSEVAPKVTELKPDILVRIFTDTKTSLSVGC